MGIHNLQRNNDCRSDEPVWPRGLADNEYRPQSNNLWKTYTDGFVDYTHEI